MFHVKPSPAEKQNIFSGVGLKNAALRECLASLIKKQADVGVALPSAQAFLVALVWGQVGGSLAVVVGSDNDHSSSFINDCRNLLGDDLFVFPPFLDTPSIVPGFFSKDHHYFDRSYRQLHHRSPGVFLVPQASLSYSVGEDDDDAMFLRLKKDSQVIIREAVDRLARWGYESADRCVSANSYSVRGGILDVFPSYSMRPLRIEFLSNKIESIRIFDPETQLSVGQRDMVEIQKPPNHIGGGTAVALSAVLEDRTNHILYITPDAISVSPSGVPGSSHYCEKINLDRLSSVALNQKVDDVLLRLPSVFLFNPKKRPFYKEKEMASLNTYLSSGFSIPSLGLACLVVFGRRKASWRPSPVGGFTSNKKIDSLAEIDWGDFLVHQDYGIGAYRGLSLVGDKKSEEENITIEYSDGGLVYVPVGRFNRVHKYIGAGGGPPPLSRLGSGAWERQKALTKKSVSSVVDSLISLYSSRPSSRGFLYSSDPDLMAKLEETFPHKETEDQLAAISDVYRDMEKAKPMDRLIYGDVGFGKTEVALRAAMRAVISGKMVFFLSPTTVLSDQHYITCLNRLGSVGVAVDLLSRFKTKAEQAAVLRRVYGGQVDVLVGTHRLLSKDVPTNSLGLLIVDEEHRFGVQHKEKIRQLKRRVDVLTLTATPIPRTLHQSLIGVRDTSKIETPPEERQPIETSVRYFDWGFVVDVITKELQRDGQIYFLHNNVDSHPFYLEKLRELFPGARVESAHGKMNSRLLENTVLSFFRGSIEILLCTTIIESGLDVQNANTIIINNAHRLGLAQLYQIRGRVGRGDRQAHCFLCVPSGVKIMPDAFQRLKAIEHYSALGSGYNVAMKDLEIRGAGNLFGYEQSGQISRVGLDLYNKILSEALEERRGAGREEKKEKLSVLFEGRAFIDRAFMPLVQDRLFFYQKISDCIAVDSLSRIRSEILDRFGVLSKCTENLLKISKVQCLLYPYPVSSCNIQDKKVSFVLSSVSGGTTPQRFLENLHAALSQLPEKFKTSPFKKDGLLLSFETKNLDAGLRFALNFNQSFARVLLK